MDTNGFDSTFSGGFSGSGGLSKEGGGTLTLVAVRIPIGVELLLREEQSQFSTTATQRFARRVLNISNGAVLRTLSAITSGRFGVPWRRRRDSSIPTVSIPPSRRILGRGGLTKSGPGALTLHRSEQLCGRYERERGRSLWMDRLPAPTPIILPGALLGGGGTIGGKPDQRWHVSPGHSPGTLTVNGDFTQSAGGTLKIEIGGLSAGQFDLLKVGGAAKLGGTLQLVQLNGFQFAVGNSVTFLTAGGGVAGTFRDGGQSLQQRHDDRHAGGLWSELRLCPGSSEFIRSAGRTNAVKNVPAAGRRGRRRQDRI